MNYVDFDVAYLESAISDEQEFSVLFKFKDVDSYEAVREEMVATRNASSVAAAVVRAVDAGTALDLLGRRAGGEVRGLGWHQLALGLTAGLVDNGVELVQAAGHLFDQIAVLAATDDQDLQIYLDLLRTNTLERILDKYERKERAANKHRKILIFSLQDLWLPERAPGHHPEFPLLRGRPLRPRGPGRPDHRVPPGGLPLQDEDGHTLRALAGGGELPRGRAGPGGGRRGGGGRGGPGHPRGLRRQLVNEFAN